MPGLLLAITASSSSIQTLPTLPPYDHSPQIDAVTSLVSAVVADAAAPSATNYLLQHAAGSGKSLTIAALAAALLDTVSSSVTGGPAAAAAAHIHTYTNPANATHIALQPVRRRYAFGVYPKSAH